MTKLKVSGLVEVSRWPGSSVARSYEPPQPPAPYVAPKGMTVAEAKKGRPKPVPVCSFCAASGKPGRAIVCGAEIACPACKDPRWPEAVERFGAHNA